VKQLETLKTVLTFLVVEGIETPTHPPDLIAATYTAMDRGSCQWRVSGEASWSNSHSQGCREAGKQLQTC